MKIDFKIFKPVENYEIFITGFAGIGIVGHLATKYIARNCDVVGVVRYKGEPPIVSIEGERLLLQNEIFSCGGVVGVVNNYGIHEAAMYDYTRALASWVVANEFKTAVLFGGLDGRLRRGDDLLRIVYTSAYKKMGLPTGEAKVLEQGLQIVGPLAYLTSFFEELHFPALVILPYADVTRPADPYAASVAVDFFSRLFNFPVDTSGLRQMAEELEREIEEVRRRLEEQSKREESSKLYI
ncbi:proteasome assembly chaperone family protein [Pyrobaculum aerophilum]|uniref:Carboxylate--amine ligase n=1 Tax=Pyrobaculum aerophilum TaxID=13773 RepID=A0A371R1L7_9CREN|nr:proteasome assembly chaperone family protein [Pyrobaculum aerophilum]RFA97441.1 carboxylate--amine ligase [Pyrobaculum aerophilum]RFA97504.1 carboxylate--amine ligase [Pyrobaculum aerophilum]